MAKRHSARAVKMAGASALVVAGLAVYLAVTAINGVPLYPYRYVDASFATAANLAPHTDVRIAGARVGQVASLSNDHGVTVVRMQIQPEVKVYSNASASVGAVSVLGTEYVALDPGTPSAGPIGAAGIPLVRTTTPVEVDQILNILQPKVADATAAMIQTLGEGVGGHGQDLNSLLQAAPTLLPDLSTTTATLSAAPTRLVPLIAATNLLASRFQGMDAQLESLVGQSAATAQALDAGHGTALAAAIRDASPALSSLTPALTQLASAAGSAGTAVADLRPGLADLGQATPALRSLLVQAVPPLDQVPPVAQQALPALGALTLTLQQAQHPVVPFLAQLETQADPLLSYLSPYSGDLIDLFRNVSNSMTQKDANATYMRTSLAETDPGVLTGANAGTTCRIAYPAPDRVGAYQGTPLSGGCK